MDCQTVYLNIAEMRPLPNQSPVDAWTSSVALLEHWLGGRGRVDTLLEEAGRERGAGLPRETRSHREERTAAAQPANAGPALVQDRQGRARCQHLLFGVVRNLGRLDSLLETMISRAPRARLKAVLLIAGFELLDAGAAAAQEGQGARIVHHAVNRAKSLLSPPEVRLVNAVLRKLVRAPGLFPEPPSPAADAAELARHFSHPEWIVRRWLDQFGADATVQLLRWNQTPPPIYARWRGGFGEGPARGSESKAPECRPDDSAGGARQDARTERPEFLQPASWSGFYAVPAGHWPEIEQLLNDGALYLQDPATAIAPRLLDPKAGETVVDLCAAPGGKSLMLADLLEEQGRRAVPCAGGGRVVAVDLPDSRRIERLKENLARAGTTDVVLVQADVLELSPRLLKEHHLQARFAAVLLDVPCSNTGVMRHRVDVKWRLREADIAKHARQQLELLNAAARLVLPGGRLVYSTCSLEPEENEGVVEAFLRATRDGFSLEQTRYSRPWESGCDGAAAFLLRRKMVG